MNGLCTFAEIAAFCQTPWGLERYSPLGPHRFLLLDASSVAATPSATLDPVMARLRLLPCPVIAVGAALPAALLRGVDVTVARVADAATLLANIDEHPLAAMTLVQLLRHRGCGAGPGNVGGVTGLRQPAGWRGVAEALRTTWPACCGAWRGQCDPARGHGDELHITLNRPAGAQRLLRRPVRRLV
ncbi:MAG: hypothetical protein R3E50_06665 [Halioglobus sp.]